MTDDLERLVRAARGEGPSPDFRASLRAQIVAMTEGPERAGSASPRASEPTDVEAILVELESRQADQVANTEGTRSRRVGLVGAAAMLVIVCTVGIWFAMSGDGESGLESVSTPTPATPDRNISDADLLTAGNIFVDAGVFRIDTLGTAFTFEVKDTTGLAYNENGFVLISDLTSMNVDDRTIALRRTEFLPDPTRPTARLDPATAWPAGDLTGWVDNLGDELAASPPALTMLGGMEAVFVELEARCDAATCSAPGLQAEPDPPLFTPGSRYRVWVVDQANEDPIVVTVAIDDDGDVPWLAEADAALSSLQFESVERNPVRRSSGATDLEVFGGLVVELTDEASVVEPYDGFARLVPSSGGQVEFLTRPLDVDGNEVTSTDELLDILRSEAVELEELEPLDVAGIPARAFTIDSGQYERIVLKTRPADLVRSEFGWASPPTGLIWTIEHPERGLLLVSAESPAGAESIATVRAWTEQLLGSAAFS